MVQSSHLQDITEAHDIEFRVLLYSQTSSFLSASSPFMINSYGPPDPLVQSVIHPVHPGGPPQATEAAGSKSVSFSVKCIICIGDSGHVLLSDLFLFSLFYSISRFAYSF